jgi:hypothetical protein
LWLDLIPYIATEKLFGNEAAFCLDYIIATTQYEAFLALMADFRSMQEYEFDDDSTGYSCFRYKSSDFEHECWDTNLHSSQLA